MKNLYSKKILKEENGILFFSEQDFYTENYERISKDHLNHFNSTGNNPFINEKLWNEAENSTLEYLRKYVKPGDKILDVGVGMGRLLEQMPDDIEKHGMDISYNYLKVASTKKIKCIYSKIEDMPYSQNLFDVVVCTDVLEHVFDLNLCVSNILNVLKPGGIFIARVPYREELSSYLAEDFEYDFVHVRNFDENNLKMLFTKIFNLSVLEWETSGNLFEEQRLKWGNIPNDSKLLSIGKWFINIFLKRIKTINPSYFESLYNKIEISMIFKKPK